MNKYFIELRLLLFIDCDLKYQKITQILDFFKKNNFIGYLSTIDAENIKAEEIHEEEDTMSLTIDMVNDKMRFKFWNGASTMWLFHVQDVCDALDTGREKFSALYDKYEVLTTLLYDFQRRWSTSIYRISYQYTDNDEEEVVYNIVFTQDVKDTNFASKIIDKINKEIIMLGKEETEDLKFKITHSYEKVGCIPCQKRREQQNEG